MDAFVAPRTDTEALLANLWSDVLRVEMIGIYDNFFDLGGHSLLATQVMSRIRETFNVNMPLRYFLRNPRLPVWQSFCEMQVARIKRSCRKSDDCRAVSSTGFSL